MLNAQPKSLFDSRPELDPALDAIVKRCLEKKPEDRYATMGDLSAALTSYLADRHEASLRPSFEPDPRRAASRPPAQAFAGDDEKIRIAGVHARWPGVLFVTLALAAGAVYQADRSGRIRLRDLTDGKLTPALLSADIAPPTSAEARAPAVLLARGVLAGEPTRQADGSLTLRAQPELDADAGTEGDENPESAAPLLSPAERARRVTAYRAYLDSQGLTPLREVLPTLDAPSATAE